MSVEFRSPAIDWPAPAGLRTPRLKLEPLTIGHVELDYDAVMSSRAELRRWSQSSWPAEDFPLAENLADLARHEREHLADEAYTYTVLAPDGERCLGCVYLAPLRPAEQALALAVTGAAAAHAARAAFWVRTDEVANELDRELFTALRAWFGAEWWFDRVVYTVATEDERQVGICRAAGLLDAGTYDLADRGTRHVFLDAVRVRDR